MVWRTNEDETPVKRYSEKLQAISELRVVFLLLVWRDIWGWGRGGRGAEVNFGEGRGEVR